MIFFFMEFSDFPPGLGLHALRCVFGYFAGRMGAGCSFRGAGCNLRGAGCKMLSLILELQT